MMLQMLKAKIQELTVSESNIEYPGSISLPEELLKASGIREFELVHVNNKTNGNRIITYVVKSKEQGRVTLNGAASRLFKKEDAIHLLAYVYLTKKEADSFLPTLVSADKENTFVESKPYSI